MHQQNQLFKIFRLRRGGGGLFVSMYPLGGQSTDCCAYPYEGQKLFCVVWQNTPSPMQY